MKIDVREVVVHDANLILGALPEIVKTHLELRNDWVSGLERGLEAGGHLDVDPCPDVSIEKHICTSSMSTS